MAGSTRQQVETLTAIDLGQKPATAIMAAIKFTRWNMTLGSWDPDAAQASAEFSIDQQQLQQFIELADNDQLDTLSTQLSADQIQQQAALMQLPEGNWITASESLNHEQLVALIRFFTCAETLPGWQCGEKSPVIWLTKALKQRGEKLDRDTLLWIRSNSDNRFLPYGSL
jgi:hypothetical protein